jgi:hypothetical protein
VRHGIGRCFMLDEMGHGKPGPRAQRQNPDPLSDDERDIEWSDGRIEWVRLPLSEETTWIAAYQLDSAERTLRQSFKARRRELSRRPTETLAAAALRIALLVRDVAEENAAEHLWWTGLRQEEVEKYPVDRLYPLTREADGSWTLRYVGPDPEEGSKGPKHRSERRYRITSRPRDRYDEASLSWKPMETPAHMIEEYDADSRSWKSVISVPDDAEKWIASMMRPTSWTLKATWPGLLQYLRDPLTRMLHGEMGRAGRDGRPAYLAYATLGALLNLSPNEVRDLLNSYRHPRRRRKS